jgi:hypothetical protein
LIVPSLHNEEGNRHVEAQCAHVHGDHGGADCVAAETAAIDPIGHIAPRLRRMAAEIFDHLRVRQVRNRRGPFAGRFAHRTLPGRPRQSRHSVQCGERGLVARFRRLLPGIARQVGDAGGDAYRKRGPEHHITNDLRIPAVMGVTLCRA